ncbi:DUF503 domain-containing protein [Acidobacteriota bacterium]
MSLEIYLPYAHSLKEKRKRLNSLKDRLKKKYNVAYAELEFQNKWQRAKMGLVSINNKKQVIEKLFQKILLETSENVDGEIIDSHITFF